jgi:hypothetical protein
MNEFPSSKLQGLLGELLTLICSSCFRGDDCRRVVRMVDIVEELQGRVQFYQQEQANANQGKGPGIEEK